IATLAIPATPGVPETVTQHTIVSPYNDVDQAADVVARYGEGLAAVIVEPVAGNMGVVPAAPGFLEVLRHLCDASGALLVFDEVITGFRVARGGAQELYSFTPDLTILGKIVGGGLPLAAFGGRAEIMDRLAPAGDVYQAGTLSGNPLATAAGLVVLRRLRDSSVYDELERRGARLEAGLAPHGRVQRVGAMATLFMTDAPVRDFEGAQRADVERYAVHYGRARLFSPEDDDTALLLGDYLYAHGLVRVERVGSVEAVDDLAELIALCAYLQAERVAGDGPLWAATATLLGRSALDEGRTSLRLDNDPGP